MEVTPDLTVVVETDGPSRLFEFLRSLHDTAGTAAFETIVLISAGNTPVFDRIAKVFPEVLFYELSGRASRGQAANHALRLAKGRYVVLCADFLTLQPQCLENLLDFMDHTPEAGIAAPQIAYPDGQTVPIAQAALSPIPMLLNGFVKALPIVAQTFYHPKQPGGLRPTFATEATWLTAHFLVVRSEVFEEIGLLDEKFATPLESADFCRRAKQNGWHLYSLPTARALVTNRACLDRYSKYTISDLLRLAAKKWLHRP